MKLAATLLAAACLTGCSATTVLVRRDAPPPPPEHHHHHPAPAPCCPEVDRDRAVDIARAEAMRRSCTRLAVHEVKRKKRYWQVELRGRGEHGHRTEIRVRVDRVSGEVLAYHAQHSKRRHHDHDS